MRNRIGILLAVSSVVVLFAAGCTSQTASNVPPGSAPPSSATPTPASQSTTPSGAVPPEAAVPPETNPPGDIPDNQVFVAYTTNGGFSLKTPEGWSRQESTGSVEFTDKLNTIRASWSPASAAPTAASVDKNDVPQLAATEPAFEFVRIKALTLPAGPAVLIEYRENSTPNSVTGKQYRLDVQRYILFKNGKRVDLTLLSPQGADNVDPWRIVNQSLSWK